MEILAILVSLLLCIVTGLYVKLLNVEAHSKHREPTSQVVNEIGSTASSEKKQAPQQSRKSKAAKKAVQAKPVEVDAEDSESEDEGARELVNRLAELEGRLSSFDNIMTAQGDRIKSLQTDLREADGHLAQEKRRNSLLQGQIKDLVGREQKAVVAPPHLDIDVRAASPQTTLSALDAQLAGQDNMSLDNMSNAPMSPVHMDIHGMNPLLFNMYLNSLNDATPVISSRPLKDNTAVAPTYNTITPLGAITPARAMSPIALAPSPTRSAAAMSLRWNSASPTSQLSSTSSYASLARRYKKILCRSWVRNNGTCHYGDTCTFAHGDHDLLGDKAARLMNRKASSASLRSSVSSASTHWDQMDVTNVREFVPSPGLVHSNNKWNDIPEEVELVA